MQNMKMNKKHRIVLLYHYFREHISGSIRYKLMVLMLTVMIIPLLLLIFFTVNVSQSTFEREIMNSNTARIVLAGKYVDEKVRQSDRLLYSSLIDEKLVPSISDFNAAISSRYNALDYIEDKLFSMYYGNEHIKGVSIYEADNHTLYSLKADNYAVDSDSSEPIWKHLQLTSNYMFTTDPKKQSFSLIRSIIRFEDRQIVGGISIDIEWNVIDSVMDMLKSEEDSSVFLLDQAGQVIYNPNQINTPSMDFQEIAKQIRQTKNAVSYVQTEGKTIFFQKAISEKVTIVKVIDNSMITKGVTKTLTYGIIISILSIIFVIVLSIVMAFRTTKPIIQLVEAMQEVEDINFDVKIETDRKDEIGLLEKRFTSMIHRIKNLIEKEYQNEIEKRNAQFMALQAQINPHFLYNTLQLVGGMAMAHGAKEIYSVIYALSDMFRYITRKKGSFVSIEEEMKHIRNYLHIQNMRFEGNVDINIFIEEGTEGCLIPMLSIQPIVENAFNYGFEQKVGMWKLSIEVQQIFDDIEITITDNGVGMGEALLQDMKRQLQENIHHPLDARGSIGVKNVDARMKLYYGIEYGVDIVSELGNGTQVIIRIPAGGIDHVQNHNCG